jgi:hypothetical protein
LGVHYPDLKKGGLDGDESAGKDSDEGDEQDGELDGGFGESGDEPEHRT